MKLIFIPVIVFCLLLSSCGTVLQNTHLFNRKIANANIEINLNKYLGIDRLQYYITEYSHAMEGKIPDDAMVAIKKITPEKLLSEQLSAERLSDARNYDKIIFEYLQKYHDDIEVNQNSLKWGYNFFKTKLNEAFTIKPSTLNGDLINAHFSPAPINPQSLTITDINAENLTLDSGHYISNRTTRAMFWDAAETGKTVEFHLGDSRTFMKHVQRSGAEVIFEINPMAANYNKQFIVKYPNEDSYRYAITNIGGADRLEHMVHSLALSKIGGGALSNQVVIHGDLKEYHSRMEAKLTEQFEHLPKADRVIIGQKGAIEGQFSLHWKLQGLRNVYDKEPAKLKSKIGTEAFEELKTMFQAIPEEDFTVQDYKKSIESHYSSIKSILDNDTDLIAESFKKFDYETTEVQLSEFVFKNNQGKTIRWRVLGNVWGDEVVPLANALKNTGHKEITYIGTTGAVPDKGYKVGDLVVPSYVQDGTSKLKIRGQTLDIELAKIGGSVEHVGSPFEETFEWMNTVKQRSDFVEIETSYLRRIFNGANDNARFYLLVSDILGSEGETLARASSSKRRKALNQILEALFKRDLAKIPKATAVSLDNPMMKLRAKVFKLYKSSGKTFQNYIMTHFKGQNPNENTIKAFGESVQNFSDDYFSKRVVQFSELISYLIRDIAIDLPIPRLGISKDFLEGRFNPKTDKIKTQIYAANTEVLEQYKLRLEKFEDQISDISRFAEIEVVRGPPPPDMVTTKATYDIDPDYLVKLYARSGYLSNGLDYDVTYNGNIKYHFLPTTKTTPICETGRNFCSLAYYAPDERTKELMESITEVEDFNPRSALDDAINELNSDLNDLGNNEEFKAKAKIKNVSSLPDGKLAEIVPRFSATEGLVIELKITPAGLQNPMVVAEEIAHLKQITAHDSFKHPLYWAEISLNAKYGSKRSQLLLAEAEIDAMERIRIDMFYNIEDGSNVDEYIKSRKSQGEQLVMDVKKEMRIENKSRKAITKQYKQTLTNLQNSPKKLDDYIAANDRVNVRKLIDSFMPWEEMEPTEIALWTRWLDAIEHPTTNNSDKILVFRGIADDLVRETEDGGHFLMSKLLTKNQGNYTRRLRSLKTYHKKLGSQVSNEVPLEVDSYTAMMKSHSHNPVASPYLSTSTGNIADRFSSSDNGNIDRMGAIFIDKKRVMMNLVSDYNEFEQLIPLIVFPDEFIAIEEGQPGESINVNKLYQTVKNKIGRNVKAKEKNRSMGSINRLTNTKEWWDGINPHGITPHNVGTSCKSMVQTILGF